MKMKTSVQAIKKLALALAAAVLLPVSATTYYWIGGASGDWSNGANWSLTDGGAAAGVYPNDYSVDEAFVTTAATISLPSANANVSNLVINANVSLSGGKIHAKTISGSGKLTMLDGTAFYATEYRTMVSVDVEVPSGATVHVSNSGKNNSYGFGVEFTADCALTGSGTIVFDSYRSSNPLYWDASGFSGTNVVVKDAQVRNNTTIRSTSATSAGMAWQGANSSAGDTGFVVEAGTYEFGSLSGEVYLANSKNSSSYAYVKNVYLEIGGLNGDDELAGQVSRSASRSSDGASIRKVGSGVLSSSVRGVNCYYLKSGVLNIASDDGLSYRDDNHNPGTAIVFEGGTLCVAAAVTYDISAYIARGSSSFAVVFDDEGRNHTWATALGNTLTGGLTKKGNGTLTLTAAPTYAGTTTIEDGVLVVPQGTVISELSLTGGKLSVPLAGTEDETAVLTITALASGTTVADLEAAVAIPGATMAVEAGTSGYVVKATRAAQTFTWSGTADLDWSNPANWMLGGAVAPSAPVPSDTVVFPSEGAPWTVTLDSMPTIAALKVEGNTTFSGARIQVADGAETAAVTGEGKITLGDNAGFYPGSNANLSLTVSNNLEIIARESAPAKIQGRVVTSSSGGATIRIEGNLTGSGYVEFGGTRSSTYFNGTNTAFAGHATIPDDSATAGARRLSVTFNDEYAVSSNAVWTVYNYNGAPIRAGRTYCFGALMGEFNNSSASSRSSSWFELGAANTDFALKFTGVDYGAERQDKIRKVGTGTMTLNDGSGHIREYEFVDGAVCLVGDAAAPSISAKFFGGELKLADTFTVDISDKIVSSTSSIVIDDGDTNRTWATALAASNVGGLTKKGAGTLTLSAVPLYTGLTTVEEGTLVVPDGTALTVNAFSAGTLSGTASVTYAYPASTVLSAPATSGSVSYAAPLDISNIASIDASAATLVVGQPYVVVAATSVTGYTKESLAALPFTLPAGAKAEKWSLKVLTVEGRRCLCIAPKLSGTRIVFR